MDYIFPNKIAKILAKPSERTQMESSLVGITIMMLGSLGVSSYMIFNHVITGFWFILLVCASEVGLLSFQFSMLTTTYQTYRNYKLEMGMYPQEYVSKLLIQKAKDVNKELESNINKLELANKKEGDNKC